MDTSAHCTASYLGHIKFCLLFLLLRSSFLHGGPFIKFLIY
uniref:Uncharacterized protein n=1 Tax=Arundo donax TaxID=35708 RepID=A0A0A9BQL0_ARUDO